MTSVSGPDLLAALVAFLQEHRRCGGLEGGVDGDVVWINCECGARIAAQQWTGKALRIG